MTLKAQRSGLPENEQASSFCQRLAAKIVCNAGEMHRDVGRPEPEHPASSLASHNPTNNNLAQLTCVHDNDYKKTLIENLKFIQ